MFTAALASIAVASLFAVAPAAQPSSGPTADAAVPLRVMSFNVRCDVLIDGSNRWEKRKDFLVDTIRAYGPDLLGTQEVVAHQGDYLRERLPGYGFVGTGRDDAKRRGEFSAILYRTDRFELVGSGQFWLSETPDAVGSVGWDAAITRVATWAKLTDRRTGRALFIVNTHWDHVGARARLESARLMGKRTAEIGAGMPTIVTGDFNCTEADAPYAALVGPAAAGPTLVDTYRVAHPTPRPDEASFHGFRGGVDGKRIDWVLASPQWRTLGAAIDRTSRDDRFPSDHYPVTAELTLRE